ncbi:hypothetical protein OSB04_002984 [Centaurea solstitialis]|uniref:DUF659 domain-containing protein n=1 Tax=Centaurea solstitialis TaxID=347529 RepID=A0AA38U1I6_9ASTR|nr:hypothetical protein OSB04_002984 [Centaurea solstitialis]
MTDAWSDRKRRSIMNLCVNSRLGTAFLSSKEFSDIAHTSEVIFEYVDKCIDEVGHENVVQIVTDNASNNMGATKLLKLKRPKIFWTSCAAHTVNLMLEAIGDIQIESSSSNKKVHELNCTAHGWHLSPFRQQKDQATLYTLTRQNPSFLHPLLSFPSNHKHRANMPPSSLIFLISGDPPSPSLLLVSGNPPPPSLLLVSGNHLPRRCFSSPATHLVRCCFSSPATPPPPSLLLFPAPKFSKAVKGKAAYATFAKRDIIDALGNNKNAYEPVIEIIEAKMKDRLDTCLHLTAYLLNPFYLYNNEEVQNDVNASDAIIEVVGILYPEEYELQNHILAVELPMYKRKLGKFDRIVAIKGCEVNDAKYDSANWWAIYGSSTPNLQRIATRILSLTTSSSGCERNWSTFEGDASEAQDWIVDDVDEVEPGLPWETVSEAIGADDVLRPRRSARVRELFEEEFSSESEEEDEANEEMEVEYESDGVEIIEQYGEDDNGSSI